MVTTLVYFASLNKITKYRFSGDDLVNELIKSTNKKILNEVSWQLKQ